MQQRTHVASCPASAAISLQLLSPLLEAMHRTPSLRSGGGGGAASDRWTAAPRLARPKRCAAVSCDALRACIVKESARGLGPRAAACEKAARRAAVQDAAADIRQIRGERELQAEEGSEW